MNAPFNNQKPIIPDNEPAGKPAPAPPQNLPPDRDPSSLQVARVAGIPIRLHFTFLLFLVWMGISGAGRGAALGSIVLILGLFFCVALHELGHALTGLRFGVRTTSITLYPIGGIARIADRPKPAQEFWIAIAGPMVNLGLAALLAIVEVINGHHPDLRFWLWDKTLIGVLLKGNLWLAVFNLIPAFPMDGGRVLRALLVITGTPVAKATNLAASIGRMLAFAAGIYAIFSGQWLLMFIAFFIYIGAGQEAQMVRQETVMMGVPVSRVMVTNLETLPPGATLREVAERLLHTSQQDFPVTMGNEVVGLMTRDRLLQGLSTAGPDAYVTGNMIREFESARPEQDLSDILIAHQQSGRTMGQSLPLLVMDDGRFLGMVTAENVAEFFAIQQILGSRQKAP